MKNNATLHKWALGVVLGMSLGLTGCATGPDADPRDPLEPYNRAAYSFNDMVDEAVLKPLAGGYAYITPDIVDRGITNFFDNLRDVRSAINNLLQLKIGRAFSDVGRVAINSTIGILGLMDVASNMNLPSYKEDFGQTLGVWGFDSGPFIVLPLFGPSSARDGVGLVADWFTDPVTYIEDDTLRWSLRGLNIVDTRADLLNASRVVDEGALDPYAFIRDAYLQRRQTQVYDGNPPE
ncbi:MAG: VacJ family lipoprotein [Chromatiaceae bacterium]|nr:VacJ family lipoprotein [Gammaproteobacteria bacterium]MCP5301415.1 VacJ family lipoprotein [Chromatiaceae bacterium]MCP5306680.1 VacJ family lipoprotein [Chromatiaceae bacterium]MCP5421819.1 VacJ family lipoprotein [Chromatiaceae bacterium]